MLDIFRDNAMITLMITITFVHVDSWIDLCPLKNYYLRIILCNIFFYSKGK